MNQPCELTFNLQAEPGQGEHVRIEAKDHRKILAQIDVSLTDFAKLMLGQEVVARLSWDKNS